MKLDLCFFCFILVVVVVDRDHDIAMSSSRCSDIVLTLIVMKPHLSFLQPDLFLVFFMLGLSSTSFCPAARLVLKHGRFARKTLAPAKLLVLLFSTFS